MNGTFFWQNANQLFTGYSPFHQYCDYVEGVPPVKGQNRTLNQTQLPSADGVGLEKALQGFANWTKEFRIPGCKCLSSDSLLLSTRRCSLRESGPYDGQVRLHLLEPP